MRAIALVGWLGIVGAFFVWQGIGLVQGRGWPTLSDFFRSFMTVPGGRFALLGEDLTFSNVGRGVEGISHNGWGVFAVSDGQALRVDGRATFSRSGIVRISYPNNSAVVPITGKISSSTNFPERPSLALATLQTHQPGVHVTSAVLRRRTDTLTIRLNRTPGSLNDPA